MANVQHELEKRRVFLFLSVFFFIAMLLDGLGELNIPLHAFDDIAIAILALIAIIYLIISWKRVGLKSLLRQNNNIFILFVIVLIVQIVGIIAEAGTPDFGDEIPVLIGIIITLVNRFT